MERWRTLSCDEAQETWDGVDVCAYDSEFLAQESDEVVESGASGQGQGADASVNPAAKPL